MLTGARRLLLGSPLPTAEEVHQRLTKVKAMAIFSSDALSSVAYATEEILLVLIVAGAATLLIDYVLTAAVSLTAGVAAIASAFPGLWPHRITVTLTLLVIITLLNR